MEYFIKNFFDENGNVRKDASVEDKKEFANAVSNYQKANAEAADYKAAAANVMDSNGKLKADASIEDKQKYVEAKRQYDTGQQQKKAVEEQFKQMQKANAYQNKSTAYKAMAWTGRFAKEMALQGLSYTAPGDFLMDSIEKGISRSYRFHRFGNGTWKNTDTAGGQYGVYVGQ